MRPGVVEIIRYSFNRLTDKWGTAILVSCAITALSLPVMVLSLFTTYFSNSGNYQAASSLSNMMSLCSIAVIFLTAAIHLGIICFYSRIALGEAPPFNTIFCRFKIWAKSFGLMMFMGLFTFLWMLLFIIPGIIAAMRYSMAPYLMAEYPDMGVREAVSRSKELMNGNKGRLFCMQLLLGIPSIILSVITTMMTLGYLFSGGMSGPIAVAILQIIFSIFISVISYAAGASFYMNLTGRVLQPEGAGPKNWQPGGSNNNEGDPQSL